MNIYLSKLRLLITDLIFLFVLPYSPFSVQVDDVIIKTENDIQVVYNPKNPAPLPGMPKKLILTEDLSIGDEEEVEDFVFAEIRTIQVDEEGNIYVLDPKEISVKIFNKNGKLIRTFGQMGQGPGEIQNPWQMHLVNGKKIMIYDSANRRLSFYSLDGRFLREISIGSYMFGRTIPDSKGNIIVESFAHGKDLVYEIIKFNSELIPLFNITTIKVERAPNVVNLMMPILSIRVMNNDYIAWGFPSKYELYIVSSEGKKIRKIVKEYDPIKITEAEKEEIIKKNLGAPGVPSLPPGFKIEFPKNYNAFYNFVCDDEKRIYVRTYEKDKKANFCYDVFNSEGRYIAKLFLPENEIIYVVKRNKMYIVIRENEEGIPIVKRYKIEWQ